MATAHLAARASRDALIDLLGAEFVGFGQSYPLQDVPVPDLNLTVPIDTSAKIQIELSQEDVIYQLRVDGEPVKRADGQIIEKAGSGGTLVLATNQIDEDITFQIYATKKNASKLSAYLHHRAVVKVGLNTTLPVVINAPLLDPGAIVTTAIAARIVDYGETVQITVSNSQEGVEYHLVHEGSDEELSEKVSGDLGDIRLMLPADAVTEDVVLRIVATKTFEGNRATQTAQLAARLPLKVRANPRTVVLVKGSQILDLMQVGALDLGNTQSSCTYQAFVKPILDSEILFVSNVGKSTVDVPVPGQPTVLTLKPPHRLIWQQWDGFVAFGEAIAGSGGNQIHTLPAIARDSIVIVQARKLHSVSLDPTNEKSIQSMVQLLNAVAFLVRPNPAPDLQLDTKWHDSGGIITATHGEPGVFYQLEQPAGNPVGEPLYFHKQDDVDANQNKGIGQLVVGADLVIVETQPRDGLASTTRPLAPNTRINPLVSGSTLHITATRALTRVSAPLTKPFVVAGEI